MYKGRNAPLSPPTFTAFLGKRCVIPVTVAGLGHLPTKCVTTATPHPDPIFTCEHEVSLRLLVAGHGHLPTKCVTTATPHPDPIFTCEHEVSLRLLVAGLGHLPTKCVTTATPHPDPIFTCEHEVSLRLLVAGHGHLPTKCVTTATPHPDPIFTCEHEVSLRLLVAGLGHLPTKCVTTATPHPDPIFTCEHQVSVRLLWQALAICQLSVLQQQHHIRIQYLRVNMRCHSGYCSSLGSTKAVLALHHDQPVCTSNRIDETIVASSPPGQGPARTCPTRKEPAGGDRDITQLI
ncbi:hypothetical protein J6590_072829 [Homalodisca vitripennis]|nr:hypothetical protein J6590_072829 [Homalodisca vitripennis]